MIYFIKNLTNGYIKIGFSEESPNARLKALQTGSGDKLILIKAIDGDKAVEEALHKQFAVHRLNGEWFSPANEIIQFIKGKDDRSLEGKFFHSFKDGQIEWQGYIVAEQKEGYFLVQLFEWVMGEPSNQKLVHISKMADWQFYNSSDEMNAEYERQARTISLQGGRGQEGGSRKTEVSIGSRSPHEPFNVPGETQHD